MNTQVEFAIGRKSYFQQQYAANTKQIAHKPKHVKLQPVNKFNWRNVEFEDNAEC